MKKSTILTKGLLSLATIAALSTSAFAGNGLYNERALKALTVNVGYSAIDLDGTSTNGVNAGFGFSHYTDSMMISFDYQYSALSDNYGDSSDIGNMDFILGYRVTPSITPYALIGYTTLTSVGGLAYGGGLKYQLFDYVALDARFVSSSLEVVAGNNITVNQISAGVEFNFRTSK